MCYNKVGDFMKPIIGIVPTCKKASILADIYKKDSIDVYSLHTKQVVNIGDMFKISARAEDGVIEALEYNLNQNFLLGVQYHPELNDDKLFKYFLNEVRKRKNV